jgi:hypothetical protein
MYGFAANKILLDHYVYAHEHNFGYKKVMKQKPITEQ